MEDLFEFEAELLVANAEDEEILDPAVALDFLPILDD